jgi:hypothetical protein
MYYAAFHGNVWWGTYIALTICLIGAWNARTKGLKTFVLVGLFGLLGIAALLWPGSYLHERVDRQTEFTTNYALYQSVGDTVRLLSNKNDTLFLDGRDDLIYWQSQKISPYQYSWYTSGMFLFDRYRVARDEMFRKNPPTFYYGQCENGLLQTKLPDNLVSTYVRLVAYSKPICLYVQKSKLATITPLQWDSVVQYGIEKPQGEMVQ